MREGRHFFIITTSIFTLVFAILRYTVMAALVHFRANGVSDQNKNGEKEKKNPEGKDDVVRIQSRAGVSDEISAGVPAVEFRKDGDEDGDAGAGDDAVQDQLGLAVFGGDLLAEDFERVEERDDDGADEEGPVHVDVARGEDLDGLDLDGEVGRGGGGGHGHGVDEVVAAADGEEDEDDDGDGEGEELREEREAAGEFFFVGFSSLTLGGSRLGTAVLGSVVIVVVVILVVVIAVAVAVAVVVIDGDVAVGLVVLVLIVVIVVVVVSVGGRGRRRRTVSVIRHFWYVFWRYWNLCFFLLLLFLNQNFIYLFAINTFSTNSVSWHAVFGQQKKKKKRERKNRFNKQNCDCKKTDVQHKIKILGRTKKKKKIAAQTNPE